MAADLISIGVGFALVVLCGLKGKPFFACLGLLLGPVALVGAIRLAKPGSFWDRHWYGKEKHERAFRRYEPQEKA
jgi:hypothetical protein